MQSLAAGRDWGEEADHGTALQVHQTVEEISTEEVYRTRTEQEVEIVMAEKVEKAENVVTVDTRESLRTIQQEIESLLAPLAPLPDLQPVPRQVTSQHTGKEMFVLMGGPGGGRDCSTADSSFEFVEPAEQEPEQQGDKEEGEKVVHKDHPKKEESSDTEAEDSVGESSAEEDDCNGNVHDRETQQEKANYKDQLEEAPDKKTKIQDTSSTIESSPSATVLNESRTACSPPPPAPSTASSGYYATLARAMQEYPSSYHHPSPGHSRPGQDKLGSSLPRHSGRVSEAREAMLGMGFQDEDGWLTQLLVMKHGDISQVLDILTPVKK